MPNDASSPELDLIQQQIEKLSRECAALTSAYGRARQLRLLILLALVAFVVIVVFAFYRMGQRVTSPKYQDQLVKAAEKRLQKNQDQYMKQVEKLLHNASPVITDAFSQQATKDTPVYLKLMEKERDNLAKDLETKLAERMQKRYEASLDKYDAILTAEFPESKDPVKHERMTKNLKTALDHVLQKYYVTEFETRLQELFAAWDKFPAAEPAKKGENPLEQQFAAEFFRLLSIKLGSTQALVK